MPVAVARPSSTGRASRVPAKAARKIDAVIGGGSTKTSSSSDLHLLSSLAPGERRGDGGPFIAPQLLR